MAGHGRPAADGDYRGNAGDVDYDLGYDSTGWDTQGFRRPEADFADSHEAGRSRDFDRGGVGTAVRPDHGRAPRGRRDGSHARAAGSAADPAESTQLNLETEATGSLWAPGAPARGRRGNRGGGAGGPGGPRRPRGPRGLARPGRRGLDRPRVKVKGSWWRHWTLRKAVGVLLGIIGAFVVLGAVAVVVAYEQTPVPTEAMAATGFSQSVVYSKNGTLVGRFGTTNRKMLSYSQIQQSKWLIPAVLAAEDRNFFNEGGISPTGILRAAYSDLRGGDGSLQGGSTITQEFVRQYYAGIGTQQTFSRKIKEIFVAMKVGKEKSKQWILENYLNTIYLGDGAYGIGAAAQTYYREPVADLTAAQAAVIAAIIQQPSTYPLPQYRAQLENRWHYVLNGMIQMGTLTQQQANAMKFPAPGTYVPQTVGSKVWDPYILEMVKGELKDVYHLTPSQIYNGGYVIRTSIDDAKMAALYTAVRDNEAQIDAAGSHPFDPATMHAGAVLEDPATGAIEALYPGPGYAGAPYNGTGKVISKKYCEKIHCNVNLALTREQVGSSFKPYVLATAVKQGMNVQTSTLNGFNPLWIPPDNTTAKYAPSAQPANAYASGYYPVHNDSTGENGPYTPQMAMAISINTAYADLWRVAGSKAVASMAQEFGVNLTASGILAPNGAWYNKKNQPIGMWNEAGTALGQASLTLVEQATMLATIDNGGTYHTPHVITSLTQNNAPPVPIKVTNYPVFSSDPTQNTNLATQVQYAMSKDDTSYGTAPGAGMSNGQEIIAKTGTTNTAQSAFFIGAIPSQAMAVALFTDLQGDKTPEARSQTLNGLGGNSQGGFGGTWPTAIWHTYAEDMFVPLGVEQFPMPVFTGAAWNEVPPNLRNVGKKHKKHDNGQNGNQNGQNGQNGGQNGNPTPWPTYICDPQVVTCQPDNGGGGNQGQGVNGAPVGAGVGLVVTGLPLWARRRQRAKGRRRLKGGPEAS
jgi:membrane peptidoglycan carboxypeptidase